MRNSLQFDLRHVSRTLHRTCWQRCGKSLAVAGVVSAVLLGWAHSASASAYNVDTSSIPASRIDAGDGYCSLAEAIASANAGSARHGCTDLDPGRSVQTITLRAVPGKPFSSHPYDIASLTINSPGRIVTIQAIEGRAKINSTGTAFIVQADTSADFWNIDMKHTGSGAGRLLVNSGTANLYGVTMSEGDVTLLTAGLGGAIFNSGSLGLYFDTQLLNNVAKRGGAIYNLDGTIDMVDVRIESNTATLAGGGIYNRSNVVVNSHGSAYITGTRVKIRYNAAKAGGGVFNRGSVLAVYDSSFRFNTASGTGSQETCYSGLSCDGNGAAILNINDSNGLVAAFEMTDASEIFGNSASGRGGAVYAGGQVTVRNSDVSWNDALTGGAFYVVKDDVRYCEVQARPGDPMKITYNLATASWGYSVIDGDGEPLGTNGPHCKITNIKINNIDGSFTNYGNSEARCEAGRFTESPVTLTVCE